MIGKKRILYYEPSSGFGGSARSLRDVIFRINKEKFYPIIAVIDNGPAIKEIAEHGYEVIPIVSKNDDSGPTFKAESLNGYVNYLFFIIKRVLPLSIKLTMLIRKKKIDLLHINAPLRNGLEAVIAGRLTSTPIVCHPRSTWEWSRLEKLVAPMVLKYICLTDAAVELYQQYVDKSKLVKIYNGVDFDNVPDISTVRKIKKEFKICKKNKVVGIVGRLSDGKGQDIFLEAAKIVLAKHHDTIFMIVGDSVTGKNDDFKRKLCALADQLGISKSIIFTGWRDDVMDVVSCMDIMVQASTLPEGFGRTCIEAMSLSIPLIVTDVPGPSEIVVDGETGIIVPRSDSKRMAEAIIDLLDDAVILRRYGEAGNKRGKEYFDLKRIVKQVEDVYLELLS